MLDSIPLSTNRETDVDRGVESTTAAKNDSARWPKLMIAPAGQPVVAGALLLGGLLLLGRGVAGQFFCGGWRNYDRAARQPVRMIVDLNRATWPEIAQLPGVGEILARRIVLHRQRRGGFTSLDQLREVSGVGKKTLARLRPWVEIR
jgi:competence ComEA-like helix-hairpin-helix protein